MELRQLRYFVAVAQERNFTRAAGLLNIAQPPLSRQIQLLEEELGVSLLSRDTRPVQLTEAGRLLYEQSMDVLSRVEQLKLATQQIGRGQRSVLSVGIVPSVLYGGLPALVRRSRQERPDLEFQFVEMMSIPQMEALRNGRIDIGFGRIQANFPDVTRVVLRDERLALACPIDSPYAADPITTPVSLGVVSNQRLIVYPKVPRPSYADQVLGLLRDHGVQPKEIQEVSELQTALGMVAADVGLCIVPASTRVVRTDVHYRLFEEPAATTPVIMSYRANDNSGIPELLLRMLKDIGARHPAWLKYSYDRLI